ncbi:thioredoxin family protein [Mycolicibacterium palauense]|uniref:thioredoxin family protein n=1 Tax=Mycolicibacterium palauense TaxID=2034511 RepID=UPI000BFEC2E4|nr:thioredoxin family protein [Mycolicibacterium palauense]
MTPVMMAATALAVALGLAAVTGRLLTRRSGAVREIHDHPAGGPATDADGLGLSRTGPTVLHFSAAWCGPCAGVRRVVEQVCGELAQPGGVAHVEIDLDADPAAARRLSVLSLPTTFIFDADGRQRFRAVGVPKAADLHAALKPLVA